MPVAAFMASRAGGHKVGGERARGRGGNEVMRSDWAAQARCGNAEGMKGGALRSGRGGGGSEDGENDRFE